MTAGLAGQNAQAGATAAENESLNNATGDHRSEQQKDADELKKEMSQFDSNLPGQGRVIIGTDGDGEPEYGVKPPASMSAGATTTSNIKLVEQDGNIYQFSIPGSNGDLSVVTEMTQSGNQLILNGMHVDGPGAGSSSLGQLRNIARALGQQYGVDEVVINGGTRTSGANPGKVPRSITIKVNQ
mgnify:CR=1 FL=1